MTHMRSSTLAVLAAFAASMTPACSCSGPQSLGDTRDSGVSDDGRVPYVRTDLCGNGVDDDDNGRIDDGCPCGPGEMQTCFGGALASRRVGSCRDGVQTCQVSGTTEWGDWGDSPCDGDTRPTAEMCDGLDHDCDGARDEDCPCTAGESHECGVEFLVSPCTAGAQTCRPDGTWGGCEGAIGPTTDLCDGIDNDCDGVADVGCFCVPEPERCGDGRDNDCDGLIDEPACTPGWMSDGGVPLDAAIPPPPTCSDLRDATGSDWAITATARADGTSPGVDISPQAIVIDDYGNVFVQGVICDGDSSVVGFPVSSHAVVSYARLTCNVWVIALDPTGALRYGWNPILADEDVPPPMAGGPVVSVGGIVPDGVGGVWVAGQFVGKLTLAPGRTFVETTAGFGGDAFLVHLGPSGAVAEIVVMGEAGTGERFADVTLVDGEPVVLGSSSAPLFEFGTRVVRSMGGVFVARVRPDGEPRFVSILSKTEPTASITPGRLAVSASGAIVLAGGSNGPMNFAGTALTSSENTKGDAWLWTLDPSDGHTVGLDHWHASVGYYAHATRARVMSGFTGMAGTLRGAIDIDGVALSLGVGAPEDPLSPFIVGFDDASGTWGRSLDAAPFDAFHAFDAHVDWNACQETMLVGEGLQGSSGPTPVPPVSQVDFGSGLIPVPEDTLQLVQWSPSGALMFRRTVPVASGVRTRVQDAAWAPRERAVVVALDHSTGFITSLDIRKMAFRP